ncbi:Putative terminase-like family protein (plasmid) [Borrelia miyamotoi FR64b]|uniref:Putative terminase-like family protein n=1 Tax=Borrelia miyamotoi FR64b TaxID=1292392 RepID=W5SFM2_9SPIR|nr:Putative terminase-like family protein [Borrelia miyamotoi FR64b]
MENGLHLMTLYLLISNYEFKSPIAYLDPDYSIGGNNSALCVLERLDNKYYAFVFQDKLPASVTQGY